jgi:hypothetical protein
MKTFLDNRLFAGIDLVLAGGCAALWYLRPQLGAWILPLALAPWFLRLVNGRFPFRNSVLDIPMLVFLIMALVGVWAAYDREMAMAKFWVLLAGILIFYALAGQPQANLMLVISALSLLAVFIAGYFLMVHNWQVQPPEPGTLNRIGLWWMKVRPSIQQTQPNHNRIGGILAVLLPFILVNAWNAWRERRVPALLISIPSGILALVGLLMSISRVAWLALGLAMGICVLISRGRGLLAKNEYIRTRVKNAKWKAVVLILMAAVGLMIGESIALPNMMAALLARFPGLHDAGSRLELYRNSIYLIADFPYTGAGLGTFPGTYSRYVMLIPDYLFGYSHNLFLDITLEQGLLSSLAVIIIIVGSIRVLFAASSLTSFHWAASVGMLVFIFQGLAGDAFYANPGTPLLFLLPGLAFMLADTKTDKDPLLFRSFIPGKFGQQRSLGLTVLVIGGLTLGYIFRDQLLSEWYADLGAVQMARVELKSWSPQNTTRHVDLAELMSSETLFKQALQLMPQNRSAQFRLGLIALDQRDFNSAINFLEPGYLAGSRRRGLEKALGYSYAWSGQIELGAGLLADIPEAHEEMGVYIWWWGTQGREDLAQRAAQMAALLGTGGTSPSQN